jgi:hypothetical protein
VPGLLEALPVLAYQGQFDAQDGPASNMAWLNTLDWPSKEEFRLLEGRALLGQH